MYVCVFVCVCVCVRLCVYVRVSVYVFHYFFPPQVLYFAEAWSGILSANPDPEVQANLFKKKTHFFVRDSVAVVRATTPLSSRTDTLV